MKQSLMIQAILVFVALLALPALSALTANAGALDPVSAELAKDISLAISQAKLDCGNSAPAHGSYDQDVLFAETAVLTESSGPLTTTVLTVQYQPDLRGVYSVSRDGDVLTAFTLEVEKLTPAGGWALQENIACDNWNYSS